MKVETTRKSIHLWRPRQWSFFIGYSEQFGDWRLTWNRGGQATSRDDHSGRYPYAREMTLAVWCSQGRWCFHRYV